MPKFFIIALVLIALYIVSRIYLFFRATDAPILRGKMHYDVKYKNGKKLDIYQPTKRVFDKIPVLVHFHGGGWVMGTKIFVNNARFHGAFNELRDRGYAIISPRYTLAKRGQSPFPACLTDAHDVLAWIEKNAHKYNFDVENVGIMGESAGAHIALMTGYSSPLEFSSEHSISLKYVVNAYGPAELYSLYTQMAPVLDSINTRTEKWPGVLRSRLNIKEKLFGFDPGENENRTRQFALRFSPVEKVTASSTRTLILHGDRDRLVPVNQSYILKEKLELHNVPHEFHVLENVGHAFRGANEFQWNRIQHLILDFVMENYHSGQSRRVS